MEEKEKSGKKSASVIIIIILLLIIIGLGAFIFVKRDSLFNNQTQKEDTKTVETETTEPEETIKPIDLNKCLNCPDGWTITNPVELTDDEQTFNNYTIKLNNKNVTFTINWDKYHQYHSDYKNESGTKSYEVQGLNNSVKKIAAGGGGQDETGTTFYYMLDNGTIKYTKLFKEYQTKEGYTDWKLNISNNTLLVDGEIKDVKGVVRFYNCSVSVKNSGGFNTTLGSTADGSFYNIAVD